MRRCLIIPAAILLAAAAARAADTGRSAIVHLKDGGELRCVVLGFDKNCFRVDEGGIKREIAIETVDRIVFGEAVGENVRGPLDPPVQYDPPTPPPGFEHGEIGRRGVEELSRSTAPQHMVRLMWLLTDRFQSAERCRRLETEMQRRLDAARQESDLKTQKNLRLGLAILKVVQDQPEQAGEIVSSLKKDFADDPVIQSLTPEELSDSVKRWQKMEPPRFMRGGRFTPRERPGPAPEEQR